MKIRADLTEKGASVTCAIAIPEKGISPKPINFLLDTGAAMTMLSEVEAIKLGIDYLSLPKSNKPIISMGGVVESHILDNVIFIIPTESGTQDFDLETVLISRFPKRKSTKRGTKDEIRLKALPNLFGRDFFKKYKMKIVVDFDKDEAYLEF